MASRFAGAGETKMKNEHPIIMSSEMVRAILEGRKTQTRRVIRNPQRLEGFMLKGEEAEWCPYGKPGDRLWARETMSLWPGTVAVYNADGEQMPSPLNPKHQKWLNNYSRSTVPSIHMPKWAARIWLEITGIRVERVQDIDAVEAEAEGMRRPKRLCPDRHDEYILERFIRYWNSLNAKRGFGWDKNPWVWVIEFKRLQEYPK